MKIGPLRLLVLLGMFAGAPAFAADPVWTAAPVPAVVPTDSVTPAARAGESSGPQHDAPFSGQPVGTTTTGGSVSSPTTTDVGTPSLSR